MNSEESKRKRLVYWRKWAAANRESRREQERLRRLKNPEKFAANQKRYRDKDIEGFRKKQNAWRAANPDKIQAYRKTQKERRPDAQKKYQDNYNAKNPGMSSKASAAWSKRNRERVNKASRERFASSPRLRAERALRSRLYVTLKKQSTAKTQSIKTLIGCDLIFLMGYLEAKFTTQMNWSNYCDVWEIDHIIPCSSYDLTNPFHQKSCFHYTNLQPLLVGENRRKHAKIPSNIQPELPCPFN